MLAIEEVRWRNPAKGHRAATPEVAGRRGGALDQIANAKLRRFCHGGLPAVVVMGPVEAFIPPVVAPHEGALHFIFEAGAPGEVAGGA